MSELRRKQYDKVMQTHTKKITRLINVEFEVDKYINNLSSYQLNISVALAVQIFNIHMSLNDTIDKAHMEYKFNSIEFTCKKYKIL